MTNPGAWSDEERKMFRRLEAGETVVVSMRRTGHPNLIAWAKANGRYTRIDRRTPWGNPVAMPVGGDRQTVIRKYADHLSQGPDLLGQSAPGSRTSPRSPTICSTGSARDASWVRQRSRIDRAEQVVSVVMSG